MKYIASWSGGKDSTASIILAHEHNEPLDLIIFSEVMFDKNVSENFQSILISSRIRRFQSLRNGDTKQRYFIPIQIILNDFTDSLREVNGKEMVKEEDFQWL